MSAIAIPKSSKHDREVQIISKPQVSRWKVCKLAFQKFREKEKVWDVIAWFVAAIGAFVLGIALSVVCYYWTAHNYAKIGALSTVTEKSLGIIPAGTEAISYTTSLFAKEACSSIVMTLVFPLLGFFAAKGMTEECNPIWRCFRKAREDLIKECKPQNNLRI